MLDRELEQLNEEIREDEKDVMAIAKETQINTVSEMIEEKGEKWERIQATVDSGAADTVGPPNIAAKSQIKENKASKAGLNYVAANGSKIPNIGEQKIKGYSDNNNAVTMTVQLAKVKKLLGSVSKMNEADNTIIFSKGRSAIIPDKDGKKAEKLINETRKEDVTELRQERGVYVFDLWIPGSANNTDV